MKNRPGLFQDMLHYLSGRVVLVVLGFASFPLMTRMLSVGQYGVVSLTLRVVLLLTVISKCGLQYSVTRFYDESIAKGSAEAKQRYYSTLVLGPLITAAAVIGLYLPLVLTVRARLHDPLLSACLLLAPLLVVMRTLQSLLLGFLRNEGRSRLHSMLEVAAKLFTLIAFVALFVTGYRTAIGIILATFVSEALVVLLQIGMLLKGNLIHVRLMDWSLIRTSLIFGSPLIAYEFSSILLDSGDRFMVRHFLGDTPLGYYSAAYNISAYLQDTVMTPLNLAIFPIYMQLWNEKGREATQRFLSSCLSWFLVVAIAVTGVTLLCSREVIVLLASRRFLEAHLLLPILIPSLMIYATHIFLNVGLILEKRTVLMSGLVLVSAIFNLLLNLYLIPHAGILGAAVATMLSYLLLIGWMAYINQRILPLKVNLPLVVQSLAAAACAYLLAGLVHTPYAAATLALRLPLSLLTFTAALLLVSRDTRGLAIGFLRRKSAGGTLAGERIPVEVEEDSLHDATFI